MNFFLNYIGRKSADENISADEELEIIYDRLTNSSNLKDRREAIANLSAIASKKRGAVSPKCVPGLMDVLEKCRTDQEIAVAILHLLTLLCAKDETQFGVQPEGGTVPKEAKDDERNWYYFCEALSNSNYIEVLISTINNSNYMYLRYSAVKLLRILCMNNNEKVQSAIMSVTMGVNSILDLLKDMRDLIRNEEAIYLISYLVDDNLEIQKIVTFGGAMEKLISIVNAGGIYTNGVVELDSLNLICKLVRNNPSNQIALREYGHIGNLTSMLSSDLHMIPNIKEFCEKQSATGGWTPNKIKSFSLYMEIMSILVDHKSSETAANIKLIMESNFFIEILYIALFCELPEVIHTQVFGLIAEMIQVNNSLQQYMVDTSLDKLISSLSRNTLKIHKKNNIEIGKPLLYYVLVQSMNLENSVTKSFAAAHVFDRAVINNVQIRLRLLTELKDRTSGATDFAILNPLVELISSKISVDSVIELEDDSDRKPSQNRKLEEDALWLASTILSALIVDDNQCKSCAMEITINEVSLLEHFAFILVMHWKLYDGKSLSQSYLSAIGILSLTTIWIHNFYPAMDKFISEDSNIYYLVDKSMRHNKNSLLQMMAAYLLGLIYYQLDPTKNSQKKNELYSLVNNKIGLGFFAGLIESLSDSIMNTIDLRSLVTLRKSISDDEKPILDRRFVDKFFATKDSIISSIKSPKNKVSTHLDSSIQSGDLNNNKSLSQNVANPNVAVSPERDNGNEHHTILLEELKKIRIKCDAMVNELSCLSEERDQLLILVAKYSKKVNSLKGQLRSCGVETSDDESL